MNKKLYNALSWTWGLPMTLIGNLCKMILILLGYQAEKFGYTEYFIVGEGWGGVSLGQIFIVSVDSDEGIKKHEYGHTVQNCIFGFLMPFAVCIPSLIRCCYLKLRYYSKGLKPLKDYDSVWFEGQATRLGEYFASIEEGGTKNEQ